MYTTSSATNTSMSQWILYTIRPGDTLFALSQRFNVSVEAIIRANPGIDPNNLQIGQVICIPQAMPPTPPMPPHVLMDFTIL